MPIPLWVGPFFFDFRLPTSGLLALPTPALRLLISCSLVLTFRLFSFYNQFHITHQTKRLQRSARPKQTLCLNRLGRLQRERGNMIMKPVSEITETETISVKIPKDLKKRVKAYCDDNQMTIRHFIADAIIDKLELAHRERSRKSRL